MTSARAAPPGSPGAGVGGRARSDDPLDVLAVILDIDFMLENSPVFQAQVGEQLLTLAREGYRTALVCTSRDADRFDRVIGAKFAAAGVGVHLVPHRTLAANLGRAAAVVRTLHRARGVRRAYVRGIWGRLALRLARPITPIPYVYDVRGALADETRAGGSAAITAAVFTALERNAVRQAAAVTAVSTALAQSLARDYGRTDARVIPSCVAVDALTVGEAERAERRRQLGFAASDVVLAYCGGLDYYQQIPEMLQLWTGLLDVPGVRYLLITNDAPATGAAAIAVERFGDRLVRRSAPRAEVPPLLGCADIGFMLRDARVMNAAASPVKFAEYLAAGLAVVSSPGVGDISGFIVDRKLGALVDASNPAAAIPSVRDLIEAVRRDSTGFRMRATALVRERYDWKAHLPTFRDIYGDAPGRICAAS